MHWVNYNFLSWCQSSWSEINSLDTLHRCDWGVGDPWLWADKVQSHNPHTSLSTIAECNENRSMDIKQLLTFLWCQSQKIRPFTNLSLDAGWQFMEDYRGHSAYLAKHAGKLSSSFSHASHIEFQLPLLKLAVILLLWHAYNVKRIPEV